MHLARIFRRCLDVKRDVGEQINFAEHKQVGLEKYGRIFQWLVFAFGNAQHYNLGGFTQVITGWANQVAHVFDQQKIEVFQSAYAHLMGRTTYEGMAGALPTADHPFTPIMNPARKVVFSRTLKTAEWANTTIAAGDTTEELDKLRQGGDGHIVVWGGVGLWRSLMRLDLIDEIRVDLHPYVAGEGTRLFDDVPKSYRLDLVSSAASSSGIVELQYRRPR